MYFAIVHRINNSFKLIRCFRKIFANKLKAITILHRLRQKATIFDYQNKVETLEIIIYDQLTDVYTPQSHRSQGKRKLHKTNDSINII